MRIKITDTIGEIVTANINTASVLSQYEINFYSAGNRTVEQVCVEDNVPMMELLEDLYDVDEEMKPHTDFRTMSVNLLTKYIIRNHHKFAEQRLVYLRNTIGRLERFESGVEINTALKKTFAQFSADLTVHMQHEEFIVFPAMQKMNRSKQDQTSAFHKLESILESMRSDHDREAEMIHRFDKLTSRYQFTAHSDFAEKTVYTAMRELTNDLKIHMHLENNILIPKVLSFVSVHSRSFN